MKVYRALAVLFSLTLFGSCMKGPGSFSFHAVDDSGFTSFQKKMYVPREFKKYTGQILFNENENLWFAYKPSKVSFEQPYAVSLSQKSLGWIEVDLKNLHMSRSIGYLVNNYPELKKGKYKLTVALENSLLDSIEFEILKKGDQKDDFIDYDLPLSVVLDSDADDLRALSKE